MLLLDPRLLEPPGRPGSGSASVSEFWQRLMDWAADGRARLGEESHMLVCEAYGKYGYPDQDMTLEVPGLKREYQAALSRLLSRVEPYGSDPVECSFDPQYLGSEEQSLALQFDVSGTAGAEVVGICTAPDHWADQTPTISVDPGPPDELSLCMSPGAELECERKAALREYFKNKRLHIVGGQPDQFLMRSISEELGIAVEQIAWISCERARPPRHLDRTWGGLDAGRDITVCITGRVGHATSNTAQVTARRRGAIHLQIESAGDIVSRVTSLATSP